MRGARAAAQRRSDEAAAADGPGSCPLRVARIPDPVKWSGSSHPGKRKSGYPAPSVAHRLVEEGGMSMTDLTCSEVLGGALRRGEYDVVLVPGGYAPHWPAALGDEGTAMIRSFVEGGGGFVGICAGAYLGSRWMWGLLPQVDVVDIEHWNRGKSDCCELRYTEQGQGPMGVQGFGGAMCRYANGPIFSVSGPGVESFATYHCEFRGPKGDYPCLQFGSPAIVAGHCGKGRVVLISPHFEDGEPVSRSHFRSLFRWSGQMAAEQPPPWPAGDAQAAQLWTRRAWRALPAAERNAPRAAEAPGPPPKITAVPPPVPRRPSGAKTGERRRGQSAGQRALRRRSSGKRQRRTSSGSGRGSAPSQPDEAAPAEKAEGASAEPAAYDDGDDDSDFGLDRQASSYDDQVLGWDPGEESGTPPDKELGGRPQPRRAATPPAPPKRPACSTTPEGDSRSRSASPAPSPPALPRAPVAAAFCGPVLFTAPHGLAVWRGGGQERRRKHLRERHTTELALRLALELQHHLGAPGSFIVWNGAGATRYDDANLDPNYLGVKDFASSPWHTQLRAFAAYCKALGAPPLHIDLHGKRDSRPKSHGRGGGVSMSVDVGIVPMEELWPDGLFALKLKRAVERELGEALARLGRAAKGRHYTVDCDPYLCGMWAKDHHTMTHQAVICGVPSFQAEIPLSIRRDMMREDEGTLLSAVTGAIARVYRGTILAPDEGDAEGAASKPCGRPAEESAEVVRSMAQALLSDCAARYGPSCSEKML
eukprot:TRINITY_DN4257_c1_g1_i1.p1 TRINITY_DN4257_c1_g1~~TRINITY_DN4257_c1_g1_i1.p1  ORF type:complete len:805 (+),score=172.24 TRINITY_DN4257_c1_g1_i1:130-2415(+)